MDYGAECYRRFLEGDKEALKNIIRKYSDGLILYINGIVGDFPLAEEIMEETFVKLIVRKPKFSGKSTFKTWLYAVARYTAMDILRKISRHKEIPIHELYIPDDKADIELIHLKSERNIQIHRAMSVLKKEYQQVLYLTFFEGFSNGETALIMRKTKRQIENLIYRAKTALKNELEKEDFVYEDLRTEN